MVRRLVTLAVTLLASLAFGQLDPNSITVSATRSSNVQPDQAVFAVYVDAGINASLNDVLSAVQSVGITAANFSGVGSPQGLSLTTPDGRPSNVLPPPMLEWAFGLPVPLSKAERHGQCAHETAGDDRRTKEWIGPHLQCPRHPSLPAATTDSALFGIGPAVRCAGPGAKARRRRRPHAWPRSRHVELYIGEYRDSAHHGQPLYTDVPQFLPTGLFGGG